MPQPTRARDFHLEIPDGWVDRAYDYMVRTSDAGPGCYSKLLIAYDMLQKGEDLAAYVNRQLKELMGKANEFQLDLRRDAVLAAKPASNSSSSGTAVMEC